MTPAAFKRCIKAARDAGAVTVEFDGDKIVVNFTGKPDEKMEFDADAYRKLEAASLRRRKVTAGREG